MIFKFNAILENLLNSFHETLRGFKIHGYVLTESQKFTHDFFSNQ